MNKLTDRDVAAIRQVGVALDEAALRNDWDAIASLLTENATFMPPNIAEVHGRSAWRGWIDSLKLTMTEHSIRFREIEGCGDIAVAQAEFSETFTMGSPPESVNESGKALIVLRKQVDGSWRIAAECWNSNLPVSQPLPPPPVEIG